MLRDTTGEGARPYSAEGAETYEALRIEGTTYQVGFDEVKRMLGSVQGQTLLDFGSGTGRSSGFLRALGAERVFGVDHSHEMIQRARQRDEAGVEYLQADGQIPLDVDSVDSAVSLCVFSEIHSVDRMSNACREIGRVVRSGGRFILMSASPFVRGQRFQDFSYAVPEDPADGRTVVCRITTEKGVLDVEDTLWEEDDYRSSLVQGGFEVEEITYPTADRSMGLTGAETSVPPFAVIAGVRQ
jgi:SAM-dependent methyltransferase